MARCPRSSRPTSATRKRRGSSRWSPQLGAGRAHDAVPLEPLRDRVHTGRPHRRRRDDQAAGDDPEVRAGQLQGSRPRDGRRPRAGRVPRQPPQHEDAAEREPRPRTHGAVRVGHRRIHRVRRQRGGARAHRVRDRASPASATTWRTTPRSTTTASRPILGSTAAFTPHTLVDLLLSRPAASQFIATKLVTHFVSTKADSTLVAAVARVAGAELESVRRAAHDLPVVAVQGARGAPVVGQVARRVRRRCDARARSHRVSRGGAVHVGRGPNVVSVRRPSRDGRKDNACSAPGRCWLAYNAASASRRRSTWRSRPRRRQRDPSSSPGRRPSA